MKKIQVICEFWFEVYVEDEDDIEQISDFSFKYGSSFQI